MSRFKRSNSLSSMGKEDVMILSGACGKVFGVLPLMYLQILVTKYLTLSHSLDHKKHSSISSKVHSYPKCTMSIISF